MPEHLKCLLVVGYHCGNRLGELSKLQWSRVDLAAGEIRVEKRQAKAKLPRTLPIFGDMAEWLELQVKRRLAECDLVFHWNGKPLGSHLKGGIGRAPASGWKNCISTIFAGALRAIWNVPAPLERSDED